MPAKKRKSGNKHSSPSHSSRRSARSSSSARFSSSGAEHLNRVLVENFVSLQRIMARNAEKLEFLSGQISKLLQIFELSAKSFAERNFRPSPSSSMTGDLQKEAEFLNKLNTLLDQNKTIAKGLSLLGDDLKEKLYGSTSQQPLSAMPPITPSIMQSQQRFSVPMRQRQLGGQFNASTSNISEQEIKRERALEESSESSEISGSGFDRKLPKV